jgi:hypothetical protein
LKLQGAPQGITPERSEGVIPLWNINLSLNPSPRMNYLSLNPSPRMNYLTLNPSPRGEGLMRLIIRK